MKASRGRDKVHHTRLLLFAGAAFLNLFPLFLFSYFPTADGPAHVYNAKLVRQYFLDENPLAREIYAPNPVPVPNWLGHAMMAAAMSFVSPLTAEKLLIAIYVVALPFAFRYAIRGVARETHGLEFIIFSAIYNSHLHWGFYNFLYSLVLYLVLIGYWLRRRPLQKVTEILTVALLALLLYFSNPVGLVQILVALAVLLATNVLIEWRSGRIHWYEAWKHWTRVAIAFLPALSLYAYYSLFRLNRGKDAAEWPSFRYAASTLLTFDPIRSFDPAEKLIALGLVLMILMLLVLAIKSKPQSVRPADSPGLLILAVATACLVFVLPVSANGGTMITPRLVYFPLFSLLLWLASRSWPKFVPGWFPITVGLGAALALHVLHLPMYREYQPLMQDLMSARSHLRADLPLRFGCIRPGFPQVRDPETGEHPISPAAGAYLAAELNLVAVSNYEASTDHFPFVFGRSAEERPEQVLLWVRGRSDQLRDQPGQLMAKSANWRLYDFSLARLR